MEAENKSLKQLLNDDKLKSFEENKRLQQLVSEYEKRDGGGGKGGGEKGTVAIMTTNAEEVSPNQEIVTRHRAGSHGTARGASDATHNHGESGGGNESSSNEVAPSAGSASTLVGTNRVAAPTGSEGRRNSSGSIDENEEVAPPNVIYRDLSVGSISTIADSTIAGSNRVAAPSGRT